ncbi:MAG: hypothetical protein MR209_00390 [Veillonellaceae bacterium]|nr:hypothetical protein [Veillonellaceae bacterium]
MNKSWLYVLVLMLAGNFLLMQWPTLMTALAVNVFLLVASYFIFRRDPLIDLRASMLFIFGLVAINLLEAFGYLSSMMANLAFVALLIWSLAGGGRSR